MKIGSKVIVNVGNTCLLAPIDGVTGTIVDEKISNSHLAMLSGVSRWIVQFDEPVEIHGATLTSCEFKENELKLFDERVSQK